MEEKEPGNFKIMLVGKSNAGKTRFVERYVDDQYGGDEYVGTVGIDFRPKTITVDGRTVYLKLWDTAGDSRYRTITTAYYRGAVGALLMFDITDKDSFEELNTFLELCSENEPDALKILVGCKSDLADERAVSADAAKKLAEDNSMKYFETSAKDGTNVEEAVNWLIKKILESEPLEEEEPESKKPEPEPEEQEQEPGARDSFEQPPDEGPRFRGQGSGRPPVPTTAADDGSDSIVGVLRRFQVPIIIFLAAISFYFVNRFFLKSSQ